MSAPAEASTGGSYKRASVKGDPFAYMRTYHTDTHDEMEKVKNNPIEEMVFTPEEITAMEELRQTVGAMVADPSKLTADENDYPGGMYKHWTNYWPQGKDDVLFVDNVSKLDADSSKWPHHELIRFLRARDMNMNKAVKMYFNYKRWRLLFGASHIGTLPTMPFEPLIQSILSHSYHKLDKRGRPLYIQKSGLIDPTRFTSEVSLEQIGIGHTFFTEEMRKRCQLGSHVTGKRVLEIVNIIDIKGLGLGARKLMKIFGTTSFIDQNFYPETLGTLYIINAPSFFPVIYSLTKAFLSAKTQQKVRILGTNYQATLLEELGPECLPVEYGGTCQCEGGCCPIPTGPGFKMSTITGEDEEDVLQIKAGKEDVIELPYVPSESDDAQEAYWTVELPSKDVDFSIEFRPTPPEGTTTDADQTPAAAVSVQAVTRITSSAPTTGTYSGDKAGVLYLTFSNAYSRWNSKTVKVKSGTRSKQ